MTEAVVEAKRNQKTESKWIIDLKGNYDLYLLLIPGILLTIIFKYLPMYGVVIAFQDFNVFDGIRGSHWVGFEQFQKLLGMTDFYKIFANTLLISYYKLIFLFPAPIFMAIILNEIKNETYKRTVQTIVYLPHFLSWVIIAGLFINILSPTNGIVNQVIQMFGGKPISFMMAKEWFRSVLVFTAGFKEIGWGAIIYIAAISGIDQELYEAALIDGAGRVKRIIYITIPGITSTIVLMLILRLGGILEAGTEQILMMYNPLVYDVGDVIGTYVYRMGIGKMEYSFTTAVGLFNSVVGFILIISGNWLSKKLVQRSIW